MATKQKSGLYRAKVKIGVDENGKDIYKYISAKTQKDLEKKRRKVVEYYIEGTGLADDVLFGPYAIRWYKVHKMPDLRSSTQCSYRTVMNKYILPEFGDRNLRAISVTDIKQFMQKFVGMSATPATIAKTILNGVFSIACEERILARNPMPLVSMKSIIKSRQPVEKRALTQTERARIVKACANNSDALYIALLYYLGLRQSEAVGLKWGDINWSDSTISIRRSVEAHTQQPVNALKTDSSFRTIPIPAPLIYMLHKRRGMPDVYILGADNNTPLSLYRRKCIWRSIIVDLCGITDITPHALRHNYITMCWENGVDVYATARFVGHSNIMTTLNIYTHLSNEREAKSARAVRKIFAK